MILWLIGFFAPSTAKGSGVARILQLYWRSYVYHTTRCLVCAATILVAGDLNGQTTMYWDVDGATPGGSSSSTASGNWTTSDANWSMSSSGNVATQVWNNAAGDTAVFSAGTDVTGAYTVTLGSAISASGVTFEEGTVTISGANTLTLTGGTLSVAANRTATIASVVDGSAGLSKTNTGTLVLSGANTYTNGTTIGGGTLRFANTSAMPLSGTVTPSSGAMLAVNAGGAGEWTDQLSGGGSLGGLISAGTGGQGTANQVVWTSGSNLGIDTTNAAGGTLTYSNPIGSFYTGGTAIDDVGLTKLGTGTLVLTADQRYTGTTRITTGTLQLGNGGTTGSLSISSAITNNGNLTANRSDAVTQGTDFSGGPITGSGSLTQAGAGTLTLTAANTYTGPTTVSNGTLQVLGNERISDASAVIVQSGATFDLAFQTETIGSLAGAGNVTNIGVLFSGGNGSSTTFSGAISGSGALEKIGSGTLTLSGPNSYQSGSAISGGTLSGNTITNEGSNSAFGRGNFSMNNGATLEYTGSTSTTNRTISLGTGGGRVAVTNSGTNLTIGVVSGAGGLTKTGSGSLTLSGSNSYTGTTTISGGTLSGNTIANQGADSAFGQGNFGINSGALEYTGSTNSTNRTISLGFDGAVSVTDAGTKLEWTGSISGSGTLTKAGAGQLDLIASNSYLGNTVINGGTLSGNTIAINGYDSAFGRGYFIYINNGATLQYTGSTNTTNREISLGSGGGAVAVTNAGTNLTILGVNGPGGLTKTGGGTLTLSYSFNSYTGTTTISGGTLSGNTIANQGDFSSFGRGNFAFSNGATLQYTGSTASTNRTISLGSGGGAIAVTSFGTTLTVNGEASGSGGLMKTGAGTLTLTSANSYSDGTTISGGTLRANNTTGSATGSGAVIVGSSGTLTGMGTVAGPVTVNSGGAIAPGNSIGTLNIGSHLTMGNGSALDYEVDSSAAPAASADLVNANGNLSIGANARLNISDLGTGQFTPGAKLSVISYSGTWDGGKFDGLYADRVAFIKGRGFEINYSDTSPGINQGGGAHGKRVTLTATPIYAPLVAAGPGYDSTTGNGFQSSGSLAFAGEFAVNNTGTAVRHASKYVAGSRVGSRAVRWDGSGTAATELGLPEGYTDAAAYAVNNAGTAVGYVAGSSDVVGVRAVRWDGSGTAATELANLGTRSDGHTGAQAYAVNDAGTAVGYSEKYVAGSYVGDRAVRWDASGTAATELENLDNNEYNGARDVNDAGTAVGFSFTHRVGVINARAVRWEAAGTAAIELENLGTGSDGSRYATAWAVNDAGTAVGYSYKYVAGSNVGLRAVRWDASGTAATELGTLGTISAGYAQAEAYAVNDAGTAVGYSDKFVAGIPLGSSAVRWDASGTAATELGNLGTDSGGLTSGTAHALNDAGTAVGFSYKYVAGSLVGQRAVIWLPDASVIDLNDLGVLANPDDGTWLLTEARAMSADGWVSGHGQFTPNVGATYFRDWVVQVGLGGEWTDDFTGNLNGTWGRGPQWSTGTPAMQVGDATFNANASYTVSLDRIETTRSVTIEAGDVTLDLNGYTLSTLVETGIAVGAKLSATGTIVGDLTNAGTLAPGSSPSTLTIGGALTNTGTIEFELDGAGAGQFDQLAVGGFDAAGVLKVILGYTPSAGDSFDLMNFTSFADEGYTFDFSQASLPTALVWDTSAFESMGVISVVTNVPEPASANIVISALITMFLTRRRMGNS